MPIEYEEGYWGMGMLSGYSGPVYFPGPTYFGSLGFMQVAWLEGADIRKVPRMQPSLF
jgi:hypothetical protein